MEIINGKYYLYRHIRLDKNEVFYIGIGTKCEKYNTYFMEYNRAFSKRDRNAHWKNIIAKTEYVVEIMIESDNYDFIKEKEIEFIKLYGRRDLGLGTLVNFTDGGDGSVNLSAEVRKIKSLKAIGRKHKQESKDKISKANKGRKSRLGQKNTIEHNLKLSQRMKEDYKNGKRINPNPKGIKRNSILMNKINSKKRKPILQFDLTMNFIKEWESATLATKELNYAKGAINNCLNGRSKHSGGFIWMHKSKYNG